MRRRARDDDNTQQLPSSAVEYTEAKVGLFFLFLIVKSDDRNRYNIMASDFTIIIIGFCVDLY